MAVLGLGGGPRVSTRGGTSMSGSVIFFFLGEREPGVDRSREHASRRLDIGDNGAAFWGGTEEGERLSTSTGDWGGAG